MEDEYYNEYDDGDNNGVKSGDSNCPRCGLRTYEDTCPNCGTPIIDNKDDEEEEYDWRESRGGRRH